MTVIQAELALVFIGLLLIAMSRPTRERSYHLDFKNLTYQVSRVADNLSDLRRELRINRELIEKLNEKGGTDNNEYEG